MSSEFIPSVLSYSKDYYYHCTRYVEYTLNTSQTQYSTHCAGTTVSDVSLSEDNISALKGTNNKKLKRFLSKSKGCSDEEIYHWFTM